jgi:hypothetical protein
VLRCTGANFLFTKRRRRSHEAGTVVSTGVCAYPTTETAIHCHRASEGSRSMRAWTTAAQARKSISSIACSFHQLPARWLHRQSFPRPMQTKLNSRLPAGSSHLLGQGKFLPERQNRVPNSWSGPDSFFMPLYQSEALWLGFNVASERVANRCRRRKLITGGIMGRAACIQSRRSPQ